MIRIFELRIEVLTERDINMYEFRFIVIFVNIYMFMKVFIQLTNLARKMHKIEI